MRKSLLLSGILLVICVAVCILGDLFDISPRNTFWRLIVISAISISANEIARQFARGFPRSFVAITVLAVLGTDVVVPREVRNLSPLIGVVIGTMAYTYLRTWFLGISYKNGAKKKRKLV